MTEPDRSLNVVVLSNFESTVVDRVGTDLRALVNGEATRGPFPHMVVGAINPAPFVGTYRIGDKTSVNVTADNGGLLLQGSNGDALPLEPMGGDQFLFRQLYAPIRFQRDATGTVRSLLWDGQFDMQKSD
jgi:hypothetical protein